MNDVDFGGLTPEALFAKREGTSDYEGVYLGYVNAYYNGEAIDAQPMVCIGVKGDADLDGIVGISDATEVLTYYANSAAGIKASLTENPANPVYETLAYFLAGVGTESKEGMNVDGIDKLGINDATYILTYYAQSAAGLVPEWDHIIPSLKDHVGSLWFERENG